MENWALYWPCVPAVWGYMNFNCSFLQRRVPLLAFGKAAVLHLHIDVTEHDQPLKDPLSVKR